MYIFVPRSIYGFMVCVVILRPKSHYAIWLKPNSITLAGSKLVGDQLRTSFEPDSVMEFGH